MTSDFAASPPSSPPRLAVILTVFNRVDLTLRCLEALHAQQALDRVDMRVVLVDDGSTDGTAEQVGARFPDVQVVHGDGERYWNGGMRLAWSTALAEPTDLTLWLNDDTVLDPHALGALLDTLHEVAPGGPLDAPVIVAGATRDPDSGEVNYSGVRKGRLRALRFEVIEPAGVPVRADTMNGNAVLVTREVVRRIGTLARAYRHSMGDYDYGLRAGLAGIEVWVAPVVVGECGSNPGFVPSGEGMADWRRLRHTKHLPTDEWQTFARRWGGVAWPLYWASPYVRRAVWILRSAAGAGQATSA